jgi:uncharacterized glyoxalase superfamily protein PhnB
MATNSVPKGFHSVTPYLAIEDVRGFIEFTRHAFDATETSYHDMGGGHVHAEIRIGDSMIMIGQTTPVAAQIYLYVQYRRSRARGEANAQSREIERAAAATAGVTSDAHRVIDCS